MSDAADDLNYPDDLIRKILSRSRVIALVGASANWNRPSYFVMKYLQGKGYRVIPVNPGLAGQTLLGEIVRPDLASIDAPIDIVEIFRRSQFAGAIVDEAIAVGAKTIWMQLGVRDDAAAERARAAGLDVVMNRCLKIEYGRLGGELAGAGLTPESSPATRRRRRRASPFANARRAPRATTVSRPRRSTPAPCRTLRPARGSRRSIKLRPTCSRTPSTPRRCSICTISATYTRA